MDNRIYDIENICNCKLIYQNSYKGYKFYIISLGSHPSAYVELNIGHPLYLSSYWDLPNGINIACHGGLTYADMDLPKVEHRGWFIGWDYGHMQDYQLCPDYEHNGRKWTVEEIINETTDVINQLIEIDK